MTLEHFERLATPDVPAAHRVIRRASQQDLAGAVDCQARYGAAVFAERLSLLARLERPRDRRQVRRPGHQ